jgi:hypothetical protein
MGKKKGARHNTWSHHETMIINLRDWVNRECINLRLDLAKEVPHMADDPNVDKLIKSAEELNVRLFDLLRSVIDRAETEARKTMAKMPTTEADEEEDLGFDADQPSE